MKDTEQALSNPLTPEQLAARSAGGRAVTPARLAAMAQARETLRLKRLAAAPPPPAPKPPAKGNKFVKDHIKEYLAKHGATPKGALVDALGPMLNHQDRSHQNAQITKELKRNTDGWFMETPNGYALTPQALNESTASSCERCGGPMPDLTGFRQPTWWRKRFCGYTCYEASGVKITDEPPQAAPPPPPFDPTPRLKKAQQ